MPLLKDSNATIEGLLHVIRLISEILAHIYLYKVSILYSRCVPQSAFFSTKSFAEFQMYIYPILRDFETSQKFTRKANANSTSESN